MGAQGTTTIDFGAFPGSSHATVQVTGQTGIASGSLAEAWVSPAATADHSADEHVIESLKVVASAVTAGIGFTIQGFDLSPGEGMLVGQFNVGWVWN